MKCYWKDLMAVLPLRLRHLGEQAGGDGLWEIRMRLGMPTELVSSRGSIWLNDRTTAEEIRFCINTASRYSPWTAQTLARGYVTAPGGHRIGIGGEMTVDQGRVTGVREVESLCIRVARDVTGIGKPFRMLPGSILIIGPPGSGKTTLLRDLTREISHQQAVTVVDERGELFPTGMVRGRGMDVLRLCPKPEGIEMALRTMGPATIAVDEITGEEDARALLKAGWCGVRLIATAHAASAADLRSRPVYRPLWEMKLFEHLLTCHRDKSRTGERMDL